MDDGYKVTVHDYTSGDDESSSHEDRAEAVQAFNDACDDHSPIHYQVTLDRDANNGK
jgi:hypothetical protein